MVESNVISYFNVLIEQVLRLSYKELLIGMLVWYAFMMALHSLKYELHMSI